VLNFNFISNLLVSVFKLTVLNKQQFDTDAGILQGNLWNCYRNTKIKTS